MATELTNLLPEDRTRSLRQVYFLRLLVVGVLLLSGVLVVHGVLLLPSYLYLNDHVSDRKAALATLTSTLAGTEEQEVSARVAALATDSTYLARLGTLPKASAAVSAVIAVPRPGIRLIGFSFMPSTEAGGASMNLSGIASTREALRQYEKLLSEESYITATDLPISAYAKERDIDFSIKLTGPFLP